MKRLLLIAVLLLSLVGIASATSPQYIYTGQFGTQGNGNGQFQSPNDVAIDSFGNFYVIDTGNSRVQKFDSSGTYINQWGNAGAGFGQFNNPTGITVTSDGSTIYVADGGNDRIQKFNSGGGFLDWISYSSARDVAVDSSGNVYAVSGGLYNNFTKFTSGGLQVWDTSLATSSYGVAVSPTGNIYVTQTLGTGDPSIQEYNSAGNYIAGYAIYTNAGGEGSFTDIWGITVDPYGNIFAVDQSNNNVQMFTSAGVYVTTFGGFGDYISYPSSVMNGYLNFPDGIASDASGNIWVADTENQRMERFTQATGVVPTSSFTASPLSGGSGFRCDLTSTSTPGDGPILNYTWAIYYPGTPPVLVSTPVPHDPNSYFNVGSYGPYLIFLTTYNAYGFDTTSQLLWLDSGVIPTPTPAPDPNPPVGLGGGHISWDQTRYSQNSPATVTYTFDTGYYDPLTYDYTVAILTGTSASKASYPILTNGGNVSFTLDSVTYPPANYYAALKATSKTSPYPFGYYNVSLMTIEDFVSVGGYIMNATDGAVLMGASVDITQGGIKQTVTSAGSGIWYSSNNWTPNHQINITGYMTGYGVDTHYITPAIGTLIQTNISLIPTALDFGSDTGIQGVVRNNQIYNRPIPGATVYLVNSSMNLTTTSNIAGYYRKGGLLFGDTYSVWSAASGFFNSAVHTVIAGV